MEKLFGMLAMGIVAVVIKVRTVVETVLEYFHGAEGFLMMVGICGLALAGAVVMLSWGSRNRKEVSLQDSQI